MTTALHATDLQRIEARSPLARFATADEVAAAIAHLLSSDADGITGSVMTVDSGVGCVMEGGDHEPGADAVVPTTRP